MMRLSGAVNLRSALSLGVPAGVLGWRPGRFFLGGRVGGGAKARGHVAERSTISLNGQENREPLPRLRVMAANPVGLPKARDLVEGRINAKGHRGGDTEPSGAEFMDRDIPLGQDQLVASLRVVAVHGDGPAVALIDHSVPAPNSAGAEARVGLGAPLGQPQQFPTGVEIIAEPVLPFFREHPAERRGRSCP